MDITKEMLLKMLDEIREYVETNSNSDGTFNFDEGRAWVALDFVKKENAISIENVQWIPTIIHFEGNQDNILEERYNYKAYKYAQYSNKLAKKHVLNGYEDNVVSLAYIKNKTKEVIDAQYLNWDK